LIAAQPAFIRDLDHKAPLCRPSHASGERPFDPDAMVEVVVELLVTSLRCAAQLDPQIDVSNAVAKLADPTA
jgi:hypothetical protein